MFHLEDRLFCQQKYFQKPFPNQNSEQLFLYIFSIRATAIPHFTNIAWGKGNSNVDFAKKDIMMTDQHHSLKVDSSCYKI